MPKSGYIDANDYKSPKELSDYLIYLSGNSTAYNSYFKWKEHVVFGESSKMSSLCNMCIHLQLENYFGIKKKVISDIGSYWSKSVNCKSPKYQ